MQRRERDPEDESDCTMSESAESQCHNQGTRLHCQRERDTTESFPDTQIHIHHIQTGTQTVPVLSSMDSHVPAVLRLETGEEERLLSRRGGERIPS